LSVGSVLLIFFILSSRFQAIIFIFGIHTYYWLVIFASGGVGDWKNYFTVAENEAFDKSMETISPEIGLKITYEI
jgi:hypothetical protein